MLRFCAGKNAGFTSGIPWLKINPNYKEINSADQINNPHSVFNYYRQLINIRHDITALTYGSYIDLDPKNNSVYAYIRTLGAEKYLVVINFKEEVMHYILPGGLSIDKVITENNSHNVVNKNDKQLSLEPWQSGIYKLNP